jgi:hypothetical protein
MRLKIPAIFLFSMVLLATKSYSQEVTLDFKYAPLDTIIKEIKKQTNLNYTSAIGNKKVDSLSISVREASLQEALAILFDGTPYIGQVYTNFFTISDRSPGSIPAKDNIDPEAKYVPGPPPADVTGKLIDQDGKPIAGAYIQPMRTNRITKTNSDGTFLLKKINVEGLLVISHKDYETKEYVMIGFTDLRTITLKKKK